MRSPCPRRHRPSSARASIAWRRGTNAYCRSAVLGTEPSAGLLAEVAGCSEEAFEQGMRRLQAGEFLMPLRIVPEAAWRFRHALTHEAVYASLLREDRRELHLRALRALEQVRTLDVALELLAFHATR